MSPRVVRLAPSLLAALLCALLACTRSALPEPASPAQVAVAPVRPPAGLFLYEVQGPHAATYLLGTMHIGFGFQEVLTADARRSFDASTRVMTEADVSAADPEKMLQAALLPPERSLRSVLGEQTWSKLLARIGGQIPPPMLERLEPWLPTVVLSLEDLGKALSELKPGAENKQMDLELMREARVRGKPISHFETVEEQLAVFGSIAIEEQVRELRRLLDERGSEQASQLLDAYAAGDEAALGLALFDAAELKSAPVFYERVLFDRNARWLPVIVGEVERGGAFIAVGAGHLLGERGILAELKKRGYRITRVH